MQRVTRSAGLAAWSIAASSWFATPAQAQQSLPTIEVGGVERYEKTNVVAKRTEEKTIDTMGGASTVTLRDIERFQPSTVADVLRNVPGVSTQENPNDPAQAINIRGLQDFGRVNVLIDGARQSFQVTGHLAQGTFYLDPEFIGQADIVRGPISNINGSGAIGGVVSFRTKSIEDILLPDERYGVVQKFGVGSNGQNFVNRTSAGARIGDYADAFAQFVYRNRSAYNDGEGQRVPDTGSELFGGLAKVNVRPAEGHTISASALLQNFDFVNSGFNNASTRFAADVAVRTYTLGYRFQRPDTPWIDLSAKGYFNETHFNQTTIAPTTTFRALGALPGTQRSNNVNTAGFDVNNTSRFSVLGFDHALTIGGDGALDDVRNKDAAGGFLTALTPRGMRDLFGAFVQDEMRYGRWLRVLGAVRYDEYSLNSDVFSSRGSRVNPKITAGLSPLAGLELYLTYAEGYRAPTVTETLINGAHPFPAFNILANTALQPEVARNIEGGVNLKFDNVMVDGDRFRAKFNAFRNRISNYIDIREVGAEHLVPFIPGRPVSTCNIMPFLCFPIRDFQYQNVAQVEISGFEGEGAYDWGGGFVSAAGFINNGFDIATGSPLNSVAPGRITSTIGLRPLPYLTIGGRYTIVDRSPTTVTTPAKSYDYVDLFANYAHSDWLNADLLLQNVTDRKYTQYLYSAPAPGFTVKFGLTMRYASK